MPSTSRTVTPRNLSRAAASGNTPSGSASATDVSAPPRNSPWPTAMPTSALVNDFVTDMTQYA
jgi:hypothetical protein